MVVRKTLSGDAVEKIVILAHTCRTALVGTGAVSLGTTIEGTTDRSTRDEEVTGVTVASQWIRGALGDGPLEQ
jgi:hypothetical protein